MEDFVNVYGAGRPLEEAGSSHVREKRYTLAQYTKHAARFGAEGVYETAKTDLKLKDLIELVHALRALPPTGERRFNAGKKWSLTREQRDELSERMEVAGYSMKAIMRVTKG